MVELNASKGVKLTPSTAPVASAGTMYFDNSSTKLKICENGTSFTNVGDSTPALIQSGLNLIRSLQDRAIVFSKGNLDGWGEAYIDIDGRNDSVGGTTNATFSINKRTAFTNDTNSYTTYDPNSFTNPTYAFDNNDSTYAQKSGSNAQNYTATVVLGKTFTLGMVGSIKIIASASATTNSSWGGNQTDTNIHLYVDYGAGWVDAATLVVGNHGTAGAPSSCSYSAIYALNANVQGIALAIYTMAYDSANAGATGNAYVTTLEFGKSAPIIEHAIPSGTFTSTIKKTIGVPLIADWEAGANIQYKLQNATEDSGWLDYASEKGFTAFTSQPTKLIVKLIPTGTSPTLGYPSIYGFYIREM